LHAIGKANEDRRLTCPPNAPITAALDHHHARTYLTALSTSLGSGFGDITEGYCGVHYGLCAATGWDNRTEWGSQ